jgi:hypothetical protein
VSREATKLADLQDVLSEKSPLTDSNRRPPPYHGSLRASRACTGGPRATRFRLQITRFGWAVMRRETSRGSLLMCPFCVRVQLTIRATLFEGWIRRAATSFSQVTRARLERAPAQRRLHVRPARAGLATAAERADARTRTGDPFITSVDPVSFRVLPSPAKQHESKASASCVRGPRPRTASVDPA